MAQGVGVIANGLRTDHPVPDRPFVDDSHIPVEDPSAIEAIGRYQGTDMWGREDPARGGSDGWVAFTTDPQRHDLAWCVRWHPVHGRSVLLVRDDDAAGLYTELGEAALLFRAGGYWWDGQAWYRPAQVWDTAGEGYYRRAVPAATSVTAASLLQADGDPQKGTVLDVAEDWAEQRRRSADGVTSAVATRAGAAETPPGIADVWHRFTQAFFSALWDNPAQRKRWALRWRTPAAARELAGTLGWYVAEGLDAGEIVPLHDLATTISHAVLDELAAGQQLAQELAEMRGEDHTGSDDVFYGITYQVAGMLDWLIRHQPALAAPTLGGIVGEAERRFSIPRQVSEHSLRTALALDSKLDADQRRDFLDRALSPHEEGVVGEQNAAT
jgi:hypothetical protein